MEVASQQEWGSGRHYRSRGLPVKARRPLFPDRNRKVTIKLKHNLLLTVCVTRFSIRWANRKSQCQTRILKVGHGEYNCVLIAHRNPLSGVCYYKRFVPWKETANLIKQMYKSCDLNGSPWPGPRGALQVVKCCHLEPHYQHDMHYHSHQHVHTGQPSLWALLHKGRVRGIEPHCGELKDM